MRCAHLSLLRQRLQMATRPELKIANSAAIRKRCTTKVLCWKKERDEDPEECKDRRALTATARNHQSDEGQSHENNEGTAFSQAEIKGETFKCVPIQP